MSTSDIYAVIWHDFIPLSLPCPDATTAIEYAQGMLAKATANGLSLNGLRAVKLDASDVLTTLWQGDV